MKSAALFVLSIGLSIFDPAIVDGARFKIEYYLNSSVRLFSVKGDAERATNA